MAYNNVKKPGEILAASWSYKGQSFPINFPVSIVDVPTLKE